MAERQQQERTLSELVVKEAVEKGMDSPLRETIVEAVEESEGGPSGTKRLPLVGGLLGIGVAIGYLLGTRGEALQSSELPLESFEEPLEEVEESMASEVETEDEVPMDGAEEPSSGSWLRRIVVVGGLVVGVALARRRLKSGEEDEWEPIEEFETTMDTDEEDESDDETEAEATEDEEAETTDEDETEE